MTRGVRRMRRRMRLVWRSRRVSVGWRSRRMGICPLSLFDEVRLADPVPLYAFEDVPADVTGLAVDYLSRVARGVPARDAFRVPLAGARLVGRSADAERLLAMVDGFSDRSVRAACLLCGFDAASRRGPARWRAGRVIDPGPATVYNVRRMVARTLRFMDRVGPVVWEGFTFDGGYTDRVTSGDGDLAHRRRPVGSEGEPLAAEPDVHAAAARLLAARPAFHASRVSQGAASGPVQRAVGHDVERSRGPDRRRCGPCGGAGCDRLCGRSLTLAPAGSIRGGSWPGVPAWGGRVWRPRRRAAGGPGPRCGRPRVRVGRRPRPVSWFPRRGARPSPRPL